MENVCARGPDFLKVWPTDEKDVVQMRRRKKRRDMFLLKIRKVNIEYQGKRRKGIAIDEQLNKKAARFPGAAY
jgi:hypothetical protein